MAYRLDLEGGLGRREHQRLPLAIDAHLITLRGQYRVRLDNLSQAGAHISRHKADLFERCALKWFNYEAWGRMVWLRGGYCGLRFERPLPEAWVVNTHSQATDIPEGGDLPMPSRLRAI